MEKSKSTLRKKTFLVSLWLKIVIFFIACYRYSISPLLGPRCRFEPSCSQYAIDAFTKHGFFYGFYLMVRRISRCHPWGGHGVDPVPTKKGFK